MKKLLALFLALLLCFSFAATALASAPDAVPPIDDASLVDPYWAEKMSVPYTVPDDCVTDEMRATRAQVLEKYPGLVPIDPALVDKSLPVITFDSIEDLDNLMACISSASLYRGDRNARLWTDSDLTGLNTDDDVSLSPSATLSSYGDAPAYHQEDSSSINCYGYAIDIGWSLNPGDFYYSTGSPINFNTTVTEIATWVTQDFWSLDQRAIRQISSATASITSTERRIALRTGRANVTIGNTTYPVFDYHFMRQTNTGYWAHKPGSSPSVCTNTTNPTNYSWDLRIPDGYGNIIVLQGFYNSDVIYFAI